MNQLPETLTLESPEPSEAGQTRVLAVATDYAPGTGRIIQGDCLTVMRSLPDGCIDAVITDPPYCSGGFNETGKKAAAGQGLRSETIHDVGWFVNDNMTTAGLVWLLRSMMVEAERLMKEGTSALVFTDWRMVPHLAPALESSGLRYQNMIVWDKGAPGLGTGFRPTHEVILHFVKGTGAFYDMTVGNVIRCPRVTAAKKRHQTEKPVSLLEALVRVTCPEGGTVLDPFCGSGSTGEACANTRRRFIGIERSEVFVREATARLSTVQETLAV